jgi:hypothetical protein
LRELRRVVKRAWPCDVDLTLLKKLNSRAARVAGGDAAVFHLVDPIARLGDDRIMGCQKQSFPALLHDILQQLEGALRIFCVKVSSRFIRQNYARIVRQRPRNRTPLLFPAGKATGSNFPSSPTASSSCVALPLSRL